MKFIDSECECLTHTVGFSKRELFLYYNTPCHSSRNMLRRNMKHTFKLLIVFLVKFEYFCQLLQSSSVKKKAHSHLLELYSGYPHSVTPIFQKLPLKISYFRLCFLLLKIPPIIFYQIKTFWP